MKGPNLRRGDGEIRRNGERFAAETVYNFVGKDKSRDAFSTYQQTPIYYRGHLFGIQLNTAREHRMEFVCVDPGAAGGKFVWTSGRDTIFSTPKKKEAWSPYLLADGKFYVADDVGRIVVFEATPQRCNKIAEWRAMEGDEVWAPLVIVGGRMLIRDVGRLVCLDLRRI